MKKYLTPIIFILLSFITYSQSDLDSLVKEGVYLHDKGRLEEALQKYNSVLAKDPRHYTANYEKAYTLYEMNKFDECITICKFLLDEYKGNPQNKAVWVTYGSVLDYQNKSNEAIKAYDDGLKEFPDYYLLHFNKAVTLISQNKINDGQQSLQFALKNNFLHASSHHGLAIIMQKQNKIASLLSSITFLSLESSGERAKANLERVENILGANVTRKDDKNVTITMSPDLLDKNAPKENNFRTTELIMSFTTALDNDDKYKNETLAERMNRKISSVVSSLKEGQKDGKGFFWEYYVPFLTEVNAKKMLETLSHIICTSADDPQNNKWLNDHKTDVAEFSDWLQQYKWIKG